MVQVKSLHEQILNDAQYLEMDKESWAVFNSMVDKNRLNHSPLFYAIRKLPGLLYLFFCEVKNDHGDETKYEVLEAKVFSNGAVQLVSNALFAVDKLHHDWKYYGDLNYESKLIYDQTIAAYVGPYYNPFAVAINIKRGVYSYLCKTYNKLLNNNSYLTILNIQREVGKAPKLLSIDRCL